MLYSRNPSRHTNGGREHVKTEQVSLHHIPWKRATNGVRPAPEFIDLTEDDPTDVLGKPETLVPRHNVSPSNLLLPSSGGTLNHKRHRKEDGQPHTGSHAVNHGRNEFGNGPKSGTFFRPLNGASKTDQQAPRLEELGRSSIQTTISDSREGQHLAQTIPYTQFVKPTKRPELHSQHRYENSAGDLSSKDKLIKRDFDKVTTRVDSMNDHGSKNLGITKQRPNQKRKIDSLRGPTTSKTTPSALNASAVGAKVDTSSSDDDDETPDATAFLTSFQQGNENEEPVGKRRRLESSSAGAVRTPDQDPLFFSPSHSHQQTLNEDAQTSAQPRGFSNAECWPTPSQIAENQRTPVKQSLMRSSPRYQFDTGKTFKVPLDLDNHEHLSKSKAPLPDSRSAQPSKDKASLDKKVQQNPLIEDPPSIGGTRPVSGATSRLKPSDFPDKNSPAFERFLEERKKVNNIDQESRKRRPFGEDDNDLLNCLKGDCEWPWIKIIEYFPGRTVQSLQVHWSTKLAKFHPNARRRGSRNKLSAQPAGSLERSARTTRPKKYFDPLPEVDAESSSASTPVPECVAGIRTDSDSDDHPLQPITSNGQDSRMNEISSESDGSGSTDSLLRPSDRKTRRAGWKPGFASYTTKGLRPETLDSRKTHDEDNPQSIGTSGIGDPVFKVLKHTQAQINYEKARRRHIPRRRASNRPLVTRRRTSSSESSDDLEVRSKPQFDYAYSHGTPKVLAYLGKLNSKSQSSPYLSFTEQHALTSGLHKGVWDRNEVATWQGAVIHIDFTDPELHELKSCISAVTNVDIKIDLSLPRQLRDVGSQLSHGDITAIASNVSSRSALKRRTRPSVEAFLKDLMRGTARKQPVRRSIGPVMPPGSYSNKNTISELLQARELGESVQRKRQTRNNIHHDFKMCMIDTIGPSCSFTGTSGDVHTVAWAPGGNIFAAGSVTTMDSNSMQYNRPNNLLIGSAENRTLRELPEHSKARPRTELGVNATEAMRATQDVRLFMTVTMVDFSPDGNYMFSAGYDNCVRVWEVGSDVTKVRCSDYLAHKAPVDVISISGNGALATGSQRTDKSVKVVRYGSDGIGKLASFTSDKASRKPETRTHPTCLKWGVHWQHSKYLLAGFASSTADGRLNSSYGETCLWDVEHEKQLTFTKNTPAVFDCVWNPNPSRRASFFAVASAAPLAGVNRGTRSVIRFYDPKTEVWDKYGCTDEFECDARDMNELVWCPHDENLIVASCTDGKAYLWDIRNRKILNKLEHGYSVMPLDEEAPSPELVDTGVRFTSWGPTRDRVYTGSSDGLIKAWNPYVSPDEMHVRDLVQLNSGVMCGAFNPDFSQLLVGEVNGSINLLSVGQEDRAARDMAKFKQQNSPVSTSQGNSMTSRDSVSAVEDAAELIRSGAVTLAPMGSFPIRQAVRGTNHEAVGLKDKAGDAGFLRAKAQQFQSGLYKTGEPEDACKLHDADNLFLRTEEELHDSKRSLDRIPHSLRLAERESSLSEVEPFRNAIAAKKSCSICGRPARPRPDQGLDDRTTYCELCSFTCLRCSAPAIIRPGLDHVECKECDIIWRMDILGFTMQREGTAERMSGLLSNFDTPGQRFSRAEETGDEEETDDEYFSRWQIDAI